MSPSTIVLLFVVLLFENQFYQVQSQPPKLPHIEYLGTGYDIILGNPSTSGIDPGYKESPIILTYIGGKTTPDDKWTIPDNSSVLPTNVCSYQSTSSTAFGALSYQSSLKASVQIDGSVNEFLWGAAFSASGGFQEIQQQTESYNYKTTLAMAVCGTYIATLYTTTLHQLSPDFKNLVAQLPPDYTTNKQIYLQFIKKFGTHFTSNLLMGGQMTLATTFTAESFSSLTQTTEDVNLDVQLSFEIFSGSFSGSSSLEKQITQEFDSQSLYRNELYIGGAPFVNTSHGGLSAWAASVSEAPMPIAGSAQSGSYFTLTPLDTFLTEQYFPADINIAAKQYSLQLAFNDYCFNVPNCQTLISDPPYWMKQARAQFGLVQMSNDTMMSLGGVGINGTNQNDNLILSSCELYNSTENSWESVASMFYSRTQFGYVSVNDTVFAFGGYSDTGNGLLASSEIYSPKYNWWTEGPSMSFARYAFGFGVVNDVIYAFGGATNPNSNTVEIYEGGQWIQSNYVTPDWMDCAFFGSVSYQQYIFSFGLTFNNTASPCNVMFDTETNTFINITIPNEFSCSPSVVLYQDLIWITGGYTNCSMTEISDNVFVLDPVHLKFHKAEALSMPIGSSNLGIMGDDFLIVGGMIGNDIVNIVLEYNPLLEKEKTGSISIN